GQVDRDHLVPFLVFHAHEEVVLRHAGVVDQDVERAELGLGLAGELLHRRAVAKVAGHDVNALCKLAGQRLEPVSPRARDRDGGTRSVQLARDRVAYAPGRPCDERTPPGQTEHDYDLPSAASAASTSPGAPTEVALASFRIRLTRPARTLPAPIS